MRVRVTFNLLINGRLATIRDIWIFQTLMGIEGLIERPPIYRIGGRFSKTLTIYKLTEREASEVYELLHNEIDGVIIKNVVKFKPSGEIIPAGFIFAEPDFTDKEIEMINEINETAAEDNRVYRIVKMAINSAIDAIFD